VLRFHLLLICCLGFGGCFQAAVDATLREDGRGKLVVQLAVNREKMPPMVQNPLVDMGTPEDLHRYSGPGVVAWAKPERSSEGDWDVLTLTAFFTDINELRFLRRRGEDVVEVLGFDYDPNEQPGVVGLRVDLREELQAPLPIPRHEGVNLHPDLVRQLASMFKPMLNDLELRLTLHAPGNISKASGLPHVEGSRAYLVADRDRVFEALNGSAAVLCDSKALLADDASIEWRPQDPVDDDFEQELAMAQTWWDEQLAAMGK